MIITYLTLGRQVRNDMLDRFRRDRKHEEKNPRIPPVMMLLMCIGLLTVLYFLITYVLMPILAMLTTT